MQNTTRITDIIHFHGLTLMVYTHDGLQYIAAKPLVDMIGIDWRTAKRTVAENGNAILYGTKRLELPTSAISEGLMPLQKDTLCFRLDRARMFLARINISRMKSNGNIEAAEALLKLQVEWAEVLHQYETKGHASKDKSEGQEKRLIQLIRTLNQTKDTQIKNMLRQRIETISQQLGHPIQTTGNQPDLLSPL